MYINMMKNGKSMIIRKWKICEEIENTLKHLQDEFYTENDIEFNTEYSSKKFTIGLQK